MNIDVTIGEHYQGVCGDGQHREEVLLLLLEADLLLTLLHLAQHEAQRVEEQGADQHHRHPAGPRHHAGTLPPTLGLQCLH